MKKKILSLGIVSILIAMLLILTGCGNDNNSNNNEQASSNIEEIMLKKFHNKKPLMEHIHILIQMQVKKQMVQKKLLYCKMVK